MEKYQVLQKLDLWMKILILLIKTKNFQESKQEYMKHQIYNIMQILRIKMKITKLNCVLKIFQAISYVL